MYGVPLTKKCKDDELMPSQEVDVGVDWFDWQMIMIGYVIGLVCGLSTGYLVFTTLKSLRFVIFIERVQQMLVHRCMKNSWASVQASIKLMETIKWEKFDITLH